MKVFLLFNCLLVFTFVVTYGQNKTYTTQRIKNNSIKIDGFLDDADWKKIAWEGNYTQYEPNEGTKPSQNTEFKILYDNNNIYVAIKAYDTEPKKIEKRMSRRDSWDGDLVAVQIDSYYDKKTAFVFAVSASGVRSDAVTSNDNVDDDDDTWDPLWTTKTLITDFGWTAEMKIPLSQLRFNDNKNQRWGLQVVRFLFRNKEWDMWQFIPQKASGWVSKFGSLEGLKDLHPKKQIEISPYVSTKFEFYKKEDGNPYADGKDMFLNAGLDGKIGITNDLTLDFAINPDFGQVEADPSEVNLTAYETFFSEKRPFFVEGSNIIDYQITPGGNPLARDNLFYSRRLGSAPRYYPNVLNNEYLKMPENTRIIGALKLTGKTKKGVSIGIIESLTSQEFAKINFEGDERKEAVEPFTNFFAARMQKDMNKGNTIIGGMLTSVFRFIDNENFDSMNKSAITGGLDFIQYLKDKKYSISAKIAGSRINGSENAIYKLQTSSQRYFQNPDLHYVNFDSTRTSLLGYGGNINFKKQSNKGFRFMANLTWRSPGFDLNDMGYMRRANNVFQYVWAGYSFTKPVFVFREGGINANEWVGWDYGGTNTFYGGNIGTWLQFKNFWSFNLNITSEGRTIDNSVLRGGPAMITPGMFNYNLGIGTNSTKKIRLNLHFWDNYSFNNSGRSYGLFAFIKYRPINILSVSLAPSYNYKNSELQYISTITFNNEDRYIFGEINQKTFSMTMRVDLNITPDFTIQYYSAPFISAALYSDYKKITEPKNGVYENRFHSFNENEINYLPQDDIFQISENADGNYNYNFSKLDFNYQQYRSNLVIRWEYKPGSLLYLVWSQDKTNNSSNGTFNFRNNIKDMFKVGALDVILIKFSYRFIH